VSYLDRLLAAAEAVKPILKKHSVAEKYLRFDGKPEVPARISVPTQSDSKFQAEQAL
jgi:hypothetical protein